MDGDATRAVVICRTFRTASTRSMVAGPAGITVERDARIVEDEAGRKIARAR